MGFKVGDIVELKSGGPAMTVHEVSGTVITCTWFDEAKQLHGADFRRIPVASLSAAVVKKPLHRGFSSQRSHSVTPAQRLQRCC
jgi:uncharacterized protein YodC (DUF2158 family)